MNIFRHIWYGKNTGWKYYHDIIPAGGTAINSEEVTIIEIPSGAITYSNINIEFDEIRLGLYKAPILELDIEIDLLPNTTEYTELKTLLFKPNYVKSYASEYKQSSLDFGTIHRVYYTYDNGINYKEIFEGMQLLGLKGTYDIGIGGLRGFKCEVEDIKMTIIKQMKMKDICSGYMKYAVVNYGITYKDSVIQYGYNITPTYRLVTQSAIPYISKSAVTSDMKYALINLGNFYSFLNDNIDAYYKDAIRNYKPIGIANSELEYVKTTFYSQNFLNSENLGTSKSISAQYLIAGIFKPANGSEYLAGEINTNVVGGLFHINDPQGLSALYTNLFDFLNDFYESNLNCLTIGNNSESEYLWSYGIFQSTGEVEIDLLEDFTLYSDLTFEINENSYKSIMADNIEVQNSDIENYEATLEVTKNEKNRNLIVNFNTSPNTQTYNIKVNGEDYERPLRLSEYVFYWQNQNPALENYLQVLYLDTQTPIESTFSEFTLLHRYCDLKIDNDLSSSDFIPYVDFEVNSMISSGKITEAMIELQNNYSIAKISAETLLKLLSTKDVAYINISMNYNTENNLTYFRDTFNRKYTIDLTQLEPIIDNLGTEWLVVSAETNIIDETTKLKLINNTAKLI